MIDLAEQLAKQKLTAFKLNKNGKWHLKNLDKTWCGIEVGAVWGVAQETVVWEQFEERQQRGDKAVCKKCVRD